MLRTNRFSKIISGTNIFLAGSAALLMFIWPLLIQSQNQNEANLAQTVFILLMPMLVLLILVEVATGGIGSKQLAILGVLTALNAVIRLLGAGTAGIETVFFLLILGAYVFGSGFGFLLGSTSLLVSALLTGGFGPWLPFQMMAAGLIGLLAGLLPSLRTRVAQIWLLAVFAVFASYLYGSLMTLWNWPLLAGVGTSLSYSPGSALSDNLGNFLRYVLFTGGFVWDTGRAITTVALLAIAGPAVLATLRRAANKAGFETWN